MSLTPKFCYWLGSNRLYLHVTSQTTTLHTLYTSRGTSFPLDLSSFTHEPSPSEMATAVEEAYSTDDRKIKFGGLGMGEADEGVVFAGKGEPLLRLGEVCEAARMIKEARHGVPLSIYTTGVAPNVDVEMIKNARINKVCVFLPSVDPKRYKEWMGTELQFAVGFVANCVDLGIKVKIVTVESPEEKKFGGIVHTRKLGEALGAVEFEAKPYFE